jgi:hypothetical protein
MRKHAVLLILTFLGLAGFAAFAGWAFVRTEKLGNGWRDLEPIWPYVAGGAIGVGLLTGVLMWLAFHSANRGYDDGVISDDHYDQSAG